MQHEPGPRPTFWHSPLWAVCALLAVAASVYLYAWHAGHVIALLPYALLLLCPLMHLFMHGGHHHHRDRRGEEGPVGRSPGANARH